jgi:hypothetical protein
MRLWQGLRRHKVLVLFVVVVCFLVAGTSGACAAHRRPTSFNAEERQLLESKPLPYTVSVVPWDTATGERLRKDPAAYARSLAELLAASQAFRASRLEAAPGPATDLIASSTGGHCNRAGIPVLSILSLGVVPTVLEDEECDGMVLTPAKSSAVGSVELEAHYKARMVMGWGAVPLGALPGWSHGPMRTDRRYAELFRLAIIRRRGEIERLVGR